MFKTKSLKPFNFTFVLLAVASLFLTTACNDDDDDPKPTLETSSYTYFFHNGQAVTTAPYVGTHASDLSATLTIAELENGNAQVTVALENTIDGATYHTHAHDAADAATTPNGTPYNETPNGDVFAQPIAGTGGSATATQESTMSYEELTSSYAGFFVVHDPLQDISTSDITTYVVVGGFAASQDKPELQSSTFNYDFNTGQLVPDFAYAGTHSDDLGASIQVDELVGGLSRVTVNIMNSMDGETYHTHAHDMADPATTPNGTPYIETPNGDVFASPLMGNGATTSLAVLSSLGYDDITKTYDGFFVVHDPLQDITTVDPTTYIILGVFAR